MSEKLNQETVQDEVVTTKKRGRKKKSVEQETPIVEVTETVEASEAVEVAETPVELEVNEPVETAEPIIAATEPVAEVVEPVEVKVETAPIEDTKEPTKAVVKAPAPKKDDNADDPVSLVGKKIKANPIIKIYRGPSESLPGRAYGGQIEILEDEYNGFTKVRYVKAGVGASVGFAKLTTADKSRAR